MAPGVANSSAQERADEPTQNTSRQWLGHVRHQLGGIWEVWRDNPGAMVDWHLKEQETMDWLTGTAHWPCKDLSTPLRPESPVLYVNQNGVVERDLTPKEAYCVFQSY